MFENIFEISIALVAGLFLGLLISWLYWSPKVREREDHIDNLETSLKETVKELNDQTQVQKANQERFDSETRKKEEEITYGMLIDGFQSINGIPDDFYSAEDPADRARLWDAYGSSRNTKGGCADNCGWCSSCDPEYKD